MKNKIMNIQALFSKYFRNKIIINFLLMLIMLININHNNEENNMGKGMELNKLNFFQPQNTKVRLKEMSIRRSSRYSNCIFKLNETLYHDFKKLHQCFQNNKLHFFITY